MDYGEQLGVFISKANRKHLTERKDFRCVPYEIRNKAKVPALTVHHHTAGSSKCKKTYEGTKWLKDNKERDKIVIICK